MGITNISKSKLVVVPKFVIIECYNFSSPRWIKTVLLKVEEVRDYKEYVLEYIYLLNSKIDIFVGYYLKKRKEKKEKKRDRERGKREKKNQKVLFSKIKREL